jgi:hypothetical protein
MLLLMNKSFPWYRDTYMQGSVREVDEKTAKQFVAAGLAKAAPAGAQVTPITTTKTQPSKNMVQRLKKVITQAPVRKGEADSHVVGAMTQPQPHAGAHAPSSAPAAHSHVVGAMTQPPQHALSAETAKEAEDKRKAEAAKHAPKTAGAAAPAKK